MSKNKSLRFSQLIKRFSSEEACVNCLFAGIWPKGSVCPLCAHRHCYELDGYGRYQCANCRHQPSLTTNIVTHRSHLLPGQVVLGNLSGGLRQARYLCPYPGGENRSELQNRLVSSVPDPGSHGDAGCALRSARHCRK